MIIYKDIITGDEMFTDSNKVKLVEDCIFEVECRSVTRKEGDIEIAGFNPSAEGEDADAGADPTVVSGLDVVLNQRLVETAFTKKDYMNYLKTYTKALMEKWKELEWSEDKINDGKAKVQVAAKLLLKKVADSQFFLGESSDPDGMIGILEYRDDGNGGETPIMMFFKHGLIEEKC